MEFSLKSCHFIALAAILLVFSDRALCADDKRRGAAETRKGQLDKKGGSFISDVMHDGSGGGMSTDIDWDGSGRGPDDEDADDDDLGGRGSGHGAHDTEVHHPRPAVQKHFDNNDDEDDDGLPSGDISDELPHTTATTTTTQEPTTTTTRRRPDPPTEPVEIFEEPEDAVTEATTTRAPPSTEPKSQPTPPPTTIYDIENRRTLDPFLRPGILAAVIGGAVVGLLAAILLVMFIVYRMRKKDEGSYALDEPKQPPHYSYAYQKAPTKEFYA